MATFMRGGNDVVHYKKSLEVIKNRMDTEDHSWETQIADEWNPS